MGNHTELIWNSSVWETWSIPHFPNYLWKNRLMVRSYFWLAHRTSLLFTLAIGYSFSFLCPCNTLSLNVFHFILFLSWLLTTITYYPRIILCCDGPNLNISHSLFEKFWLLLLVLISIGIGNGIRSQDLDVGHIPHYKGIFASSPLASKSNLCIYTIYQNFIYSHRCIKQENTTQMPLSLY